MSINFPHYQQVQAVREITGNNFSKGQINFLFGPYGKNWRWNPSKSFFKIRLKLTKGDDSLLSTADEVAFNQYPCDNLFQKVCQKINDTPVSERNDYVAQVASLKHRFKPKSWRDSVGKTCYSESRFEDRLNRCSVDGVEVKKSDYTLFRRNVVGLQDDAGASLLDTNTFEIAVDTGVATFAVGVIPDVRQIFLPGDILELDLGNTGSRARYTVTSVPTAATLQLQFLQTIVVAAAALNVNNLYLTRRVISESERANDIELIWRPDLGFYMIDKWLPSGVYNFQATPHPSVQFQRYAIESIVNKQVGNTFNDIKLEVVSMLMYVYTGSTESVQSSNMNIVYPECRLQSQNLTTNTLTQKTFVINPNAYAMTLAFQDAAAGEDTTLSRSKFKINGNRERDIIRFYLRRGKQELPSPYPDPSLVGNQQYIAQLYTENLMYTGNYFERGGQEDIDEYLNNGLYFHYLFDGKNMDERVYISTQFSGANFAINPQVLLFDHFMRSLVLEIKDGEIYRAAASATN